MFFYKLNMLSNPGNINYFLSLDIVMLCIVTQCKFSVFNEAIFLEFSRDNMRLPTKW